MKMHRRLDGRGEPKGGGGRKRRPEKKAEGAGTGEARGNKKESEVAELVSRRKGERARSAGGERAERDRGKGRGNRGRKERGGKERK